MADTIVTTPTPIVVVSELDKAIMEERIALTPGLVQRRMALYAPKNLAKMTTEAITAEDEALTAGLILEATAKAKARLAQAEANAAAAEAVRQKSEQAFVSIVTDALRKAWLAVGADATLREIANVNPNITRVLAVVEVGRTKVFADADMETITNGEATTKKPKQGAIPASIAIQIPALLVSLGELRSASKDSRRGAVTISAAPSTPRAGSRQPVKVLFPDGSVKEYKSNKAAYVALVGETTTQMNAYSIWQALGGKGYRPVK